MSIVSKATVKSTFETGDKPTQSEFEDFIDSSMRDSMIAIATAAESGKTGIIEIQASALVTALPSGQLGRLLLETSAAVSARVLMSAGTVGDAIFIADTTASAQGHIGGGTVGIEILEADTTASAQGHIGGGTAGIQVMEAETTASARDSLGILNLQTPVSASGTEVDFTGISDASRITILLQGLSTNGTALVRIVLGDSGGFETSGYLGAGGDLDPTPVFANRTDSFVFRATHAATTIYHGILTLVLINSATNTWAFAGTVAQSNTAVMGTGAGTKSLSGVLTQIRITADGVDTFDAGTINLLVE